MWKATEALWRIISSERQGEKTYADDDGTDSLWIYPVWNGQGRDGNCMEQGGPHLPGMHWIGVMEDEGKALG